MAGTTGLEPATSDVTGRRSNQLNYVPACQRAAPNRIPQAGENRFLVHTREPLHLAHYNIPVGGLWAHGQVGFEIAARGLKPAELD